MKKASKKSSSTWTTQAPVPAINQRILVEHHENAVRETISSMLRAEGYECRHVSSPREVWALLNSGEEFDLLLCNLSESLKAGLVKRVTKRFPDTLVVMIGARPISMFLLALQMGAYEYLPIPFERGQLLPVVRRALEHRRLRVENRALQAKLAELLRKELF